MKALGRAGAVFLWNAALMAAQSGSTYFELKMPDLNRVIGSGNAMVADIPPNHLSRLVIQVLGSADKNLGYADVHVRINGKGVSNIFNSGANDRGKFLSMDPLTLSARHDAIFDPSENTIEVYGTDRRNRTYYQNWILRSGAENLNPSFTYVSQMAPGDEEGLPPDLNVEQPSRSVAAPAGSNAQFKVRVKGTAAAPSGIQSVTANGKPVRCVAAGTSSGFDEPILLSHLDNVLVLEVIDKKGNRRSIGIPVSHPGDPARTMRFKGEHAFALLIGVSRFSSMANPLPPITAAAADARLLAQSLKQRGFLDSNMRILTDKQATQEQVQTALKDFAARAKPDDLLVIFISTHGLHDPTAPDHIYLAAEDTQARALSSTAIEISDLQLTLARSLRSRHTLLFFDLEHPLGTDWSFGGKPLIHSHVLNLLSETAGSAVLVASAPGQDSQEKSDGSEARGVFAAALASAFAGGADTNHDAVLTPRELCEFVSENVRSATGTKQTPEFRFGSLEADTPIMALR